jgi:hypothetical protein
VDVNIEQVGPIKSIACPSSHPISFELGRPENSASSSNSPDSHHASVKFISESFLSTDFILTIKANHLDVPRAVAEPHPSPNHSTTAMVLTLVPRFNIPDVKGGAEFIFLVDRSGSMSGSRMKAAKKALVILLRGLPTKDTMFNIWSFGNRRSALWQKSQTYSASTLEEATQHVDSMTANYGGTEIELALEAVFDGRLKSADGTAQRATNVFVLTDGDCWSVDPVVRCVDNAVDSSPNNAPCRVFCLGIGSGISTHMCEGIARAGTGFALYVNDGEEMTGKCAKMVRAARTPVVEDISVEWCASSTTSGLSPVRNAAEDDFEMVEPDTEESTDLEPEVAPKKINLFDAGASQDAPATGPSPVPNISPSELPEELIQQGPYRIPCLYPGVRFLVYAIISDKVLPRGGAVPEKVVLRGKVRGTGDTVQLEVPVQVAEAEGATGISMPVHTLAARQLITCLEHSEHNFPPSIASKEDLLPGYIKAKTIQLGLTYQITSKHTSFVCVDHDSPPVSVAADGIMTIPTTNRARKRRGSKRSAVRGGRNRDKAVAPGSAGRSALVCEADNDEDGKDEDDSLPIRPSSAPRGKAVRLREPQLELSSRCFLLIEIPFTDIISFRSKEVEKNCV